MKIDLSKFVEIKESEYTITNAIYFKENNELKLTIESNLDHLDERLRQALDEYFFYVTLTIEFIKLSPAVEEDFAGNDITENINEVEVIEDQDLKTEVIEPAEETEVDSDFCDNLFKKKEEELADC